jgi:tRNA 2-thiouridine synthesizing protein A
MADKFLDCKGMMCPMPIVNISKAIKDMKSGQTLEVHATDTPFKFDLEAWCKRTNNELVSFVQEGNISKATVKLR